VTLLGDKAVKPEGVFLEKAVDCGWRSGRCRRFAAAPINSCSISTSRWRKAPMNLARYDSESISSLPPERFAFEIVNMSLEVH